MVYMNTPIKWQVHGINNFRMCRVIVVKHGRYKCVCARRELIIILHVPIIVFVKKKNFKKIPCPPQSLFTHTHNVFFGYV